MKEIVVCALLAFLFILPANALHTWTGSVSNQWNQPQNWNPQSVPTNTDDVVIPATWTNEIIIDGANASCRAFTYQGSGFDLRLLAGWKLILSGDLNLSGNTNFTGPGIMELASPTAVSLNYSDSVTFSIQGIEVKSGGAVNLTNELSLPYGFLKIYSGDFLANGFDIGFINIFIMPGGLNRSLNVAQSDVNVGRMYLYLNPGGTFAGQQAVINVTTSVTIAGSCLFTTLNCNTGVVILQEEPNSSVNIKNLNANGDIFITGSKNATGQVYSIQNLNVLRAPAIVQMTVSPYVTAYNFANITIPAPCQGQVLFTDGSEVNANRVQMNMLVPEQLNGAAFANISTAPGSLVVTNGTQLGNTNGVQFFLTAPQTYYWVGGQGEWSDGGHWSLTSGGAPSGCLPKMHDHVRFDSQSGFGASDSVFVDHHAFCNDLLSDAAAANKPMLCSKFYNNQTLNVSGSMDLSGFRMFMFDSPTNFWGGGFHTIRMAGHSFQNTISFLTPGTWTLQDALICREGTRPVNHMNGTLITNGHEIRAGAFISNSIKLPYSNRGLQLGSSKIYIGHPQQMAGLVTINSQNLTLSAGTSEFRFGYLGDDISIFQILGAQHLQFSSLTFENRTAAPVLIYNQKSSFRKISFMGNGSLLGTSASVQPQMSGADTLVVTTGYRYEFEQNGYIAITGTVETRVDSCDHVALFTTTDFSNQANIYHTQPLTLKQVMVENHRSAGAPATVQNGYDGSGNTNFVFSTSVAPHIYYWNGEANTAQWGNARNWNIDIAPVNGAANDLPNISNPQGCIPGFLDSVVFHVNSFPLKDTVTIDQPCNYNGMQWMTGTGTGRVINGSASYSNNNYGALQYAAGLAIYYTGPNYFRSHESRSIFTDGVSIPGTVHFKCSGSYHLADDLECYGNKLEVLSGSFYSNAYTMELKNFVVNHTFAPYNNNNVVNLEGSLLTIINSWNNYLYQGKSVFLADSTTTVFTGVNSSMGFLGNHPQVAVNDVDFLSPGTGIINSASSTYPVTFRNVKFSGNGIINGNNNFDTLVFAEGREYQLGSTYTQIILQALISRGSPCYRTTITSTTPGVRAFITHPSCNIVIEHARVRDLEGLLNGCGANNYIVNVGGEDMGNNQNWGFVPGNPINGLGNDTLAGCHSLPFVISSAGFGTYQTITWDNGSQQPTYTAMGNDTVMALVVYSPICQVQDTRIVRVQNTLSATAQITSEPCFGDTLGTLDVSASGGNGHYSYTWNNVAQNQLANDSSAHHLSAGTYTMNIAQTGFENICFTAQSYTVAEPTRLTVSAAVQPVTCNGNDDGAISLHVNGGTGGYTFNWPSNSSLTDSIASQLAPGTYGAEVTDANGCIATVAADITEPALLEMTFTATDANCGLADGTALVQPAGGTAPYVVTWSHDSLQTATQLNDLRGGNYTVTVEDSNHCRIEHNYTIGELNRPQTAVSVTGATCYGTSTGLAEINVSGGFSPYTYSLEDTLQNPLGTQTASNQFTGLAAGAYLIVTKDDHGCIVKDTVYVGGPAKLNVTATVVNAPSCYGFSDGTVGSAVTGGTAPYAYSWAHDGSVNPAASGLAASSYALTVTDANNCTATDTVALVQPEPLSAAIEITRPVQCHGNNDAVLTAVATGGNSGYASAWWPTNAGGQTISAGAGTHVMILTDAKGCSDTASVTLSEPELLEVELVSVLPGKCNTPEGFADISVRGGTPVYGFSWSNGNQQEDLDNGLPGTHTVTVTDANGCIASLTAELNCVDQLNIPELVTPNYDGYNDKWTIHDLDRLYPSNSVKILNRWGNVVYQESPYTHSFHGESNTGTSLGAGLLPSGTYFYIIDLGQEGGEYTGYLELQY